MCGRCAAGLPSAPPCPALPCPTATVFLPPRSLTSLPCPVLPCPAPLLPMQWNMWSIQKDPRFQEKFGVTPAEEEEIKEKIEWGWWPSSWSFRFKSSSPSDQ